MPITGHSGRIRPTFMHGGGTMASKADKRLDWVRIARWSFPALLLLIPLIARFPWSGADFVVMGVLLFGSVGLYELAARMHNSLPYRAAAAIAVVTSFLLIWVNLAVGIIGSENNPLNLVYAAVLGAVLLGAIVSRFEPAGMARALFATAALQALAGVVGVVAASNEPPGAAGQVVLNGGFVALWLLSAALFRKAARAA